MMMQSHLYKNKILKHYGFIHLLMSILLSIYLSEGYHVPHQLCDLGQAAQSLCASGPPVTPTGERGLVMANALWDFVKMYELI